MAKSNDPMPSQSSSVSVGSLKPEPELSVGERVEVLWKIERDPEDEGLQSEERWWGASVQSREGHSDTYTLLYDEYMEFPPANVRVSILGPRSLRDEDAGGEVMFWRKEGESSMPDDALLPVSHEFNEHVEGEGDDDDRTVPDGDLYSMKDLVRAQDEVDEEQGERADDAMMAALGSLPLTQQTEMAIQYRAFADELKSELAQLMHQRGQGCIITEGDIHNLFEKIRKGRQDG